MNAATMIRRTFGHAGHAVRGALVLHALCCAAPAAAQGAPAVSITLAEAQAKGEPPIAAGIALSFVTPAP